MPFLRREYLVLAIILLLATALRVGWPGLTEFKFSEARLEALALELTREGRAPLVGVPSSAGFDHSPISVYLYVPAFVLTSNPIVATVYGGLVGVIAVAFSWWLARRWSGGGRIAALVAVLLFTASPWAVSFSRKIWQVAFVPLLALMFVGLIISALIEERARGGRWRLTWALVAFAILLQVHPSAVSLAPALALWLLIFWRRVRLVPLLVGGGLGALTALPFLVHQAQSAWPAVSALRTLPPATWNLAAIRLAWEVISGRGIHALAGEAYPLLEIVPQLGWFFNLIGWLTTGAALWLLRRALRDWQVENVRRRRAARIDLVLVTWLLVPVLFNLRHSLDLHLHFFALILPTAYLTIGRAAESVRHVCSEPWLRRAAMVGFGLLAGAQVLALVLMGRFVASHDTPGGFGTPLSHYLEIANKVIAEASTEDSKEVLVVGQGDSIVIHEIPAIFDVLFRDRLVYRFVDGRSAALFPPRPALALLTPQAGEAVAWYDSWAMRNLPHSYRLASLDGSWPRDMLTLMTGPRVFENGTELQAYTSTADGALEGRFKLWLQWQVLWLSPDDTHFSVQLMNREGDLWGQQDTPGYPTEYRQKGDRVISLFDITARQGSSYQPGRAWVGLYVYPQVIPVPIIDGDGNVVDDGVNLDLQGRES